MDKSILNLRNSFLKVTPQRVAIYEYLLSTYSHPTAQTIYEAIRVQFPSISFATVYKTLNILRDAGLVLEFNVGGDCFRYDANTLSHPHFICRKCNDVSDLNIPKDISDFSDALSNSNDGYQIDHADIYLYGTCNTCNKEAI